MGYLFNTMHTLYFYKLKTTSGTFLFFTMEEVYIIIYKKRSVGVITGFNFG